MVISCSTDTIEQSEQLYVPFNAKVQDKNLDQIIEPIVLKYFDVLAHLAEGDSVALQQQGLFFIELTDSLASMISLNDSLIQTITTQGLMNLKAEMNAILLEDAHSERLFGVNMLSLHLIQFLASIGYEKQLLYIYSDTEEQHWISNRRKAKNPYLQNPERLFEANQVLQELR